MMELLAFLPLLISSGIFIACLVSAMAKQSGGRFFGASLITLFLLCGGSIALFSFAPNLIMDNSWYHHLFGGEYGVIVFVFFYAQVLPGLASMIAFAIVSASVSRYVVQNPYGY